MSARTYFLSARTTLVATGLVCAIILGAVAVRLRDLMLVPRLTDESREVMIGFDIYRGMVRPLVGIDTYIGSMFSYLVAGAFFVLGPRPDAGRLLVLGFGALGIVPTYLLGRAVGGPGLRGQVVGLLAALLLAGSATDILITSRLAYSNSLTPLFSTTGIWLLHRAVAQRSGPTLAAAGLTLGLALQTHVAALAIWPGLAVYLALHRRAVSFWWLCAAAVLAILAISNIIAFNVINVGATMNEILYRSSDYGGAPSAGLTGWGDRLLILLRAYALALGGRVSEYIEPEALLTLPVLLYAGLGLAGLGILIRRREWLPVLAILSGLLVISLLNARLEPIVARSRHYAQLLPVGFVVIAVALDALRVWVARYGNPAVSWLTVAALVVVLLGLSQWQLQAYLADRLDRPEKNNRALLAAAEAVVRGDRRSERVYVDALLASADVNSNRRGLRDIEFVLAIRGQEYEVIDLTRRPLPVGRTGIAARRVLLGEESTELARQHFRLSPLPGDPGEGARFRAFLASPREAPVP
jgi:hypothetical protein